MSEPIYDVIIAGAGTAGMSAGYYLARSGARVLMIDAFDPPHQKGSHHGDTRLIRHAYKKGPAYIPLTLRADELWQEVEQETGTTLLVRSGVLNIADPERYSFRNRPEDAGAFGVSVEMLDSWDMRLRWPGLRFPEHYVGMFEPQAGYLLSEKCIAAYRKLAEAAGAKLLTNTPVLRISATNEGVTVETRNGTYRGDKALLSVGAWFEQLVPFVSLPIQPLRIPVGWFQTKGSDFKAGNFPGFTLHNADGGFYGFPDIDGGGLKIGKHDGGKDWRPGQPMEAFGTYEEDESYFRKILSTFMPNASGKLLRGSVCKYEFTPDEDFIIDRHPEHPNVLLAGGFSGHGFKFSSVLGELAADLLLKGESRFDLSPFSLSRFSK